MQLLSSEFALKNIYIYIYKVGGGGGRGEVLVYRHYSLRDEQMVSLQRESQCCLETFDAHHQYLLDHTPFKCITQLTYTRFKHKL